MNHFHPRAGLRLALPLAALLLTPAWASAGEGHDHGEAAPTVSGPALPRFAAESELFELVGVLKGPQITLYLDRAADNSPVTGAQIELEIAGQKLKAVPHDGGTFEVMLAQAPEHGVLAVTAKVTSGTEVDLLATELELPDDAHDHDEAPGRSWRRLAAWSAAGLAGVALLAWGWRRLRAQRRNLIGGAA